MKTNRKLQDKIRIRIPKGYSIKVECVKPYTYETYIPVEEALKCYKKPLKYFNFYVRLYHNDNSIGAVELLSQERYDYYNDRVVDIYHETHSNLDEKYHGKGLGALMYTYAINWALKRGLNVQSSGSSSDEAIRVWRGKTLKKYFRMYRDSGGCRKDDLSCSTWYPRFKLAKQSSIDSSTR